MIDNAFVYRWSETSKQSWNTTTEKKKLEESKAQNNLVNKTLYQEQGFANLQG